MYDFASLRTTRLCSVSKISRIMLNKNATGSCQSTRIIIQRNNQLFKNNQPTLKSVISCKLKCLSSLKAGNDNHSNIITNHSQKSFQYTVSQFKRMHHYRIVCNCDKDRQLEWNFLYHMHYAGISYIMPPQTPWKIPSAYVF